MQPDPAKSLPLPDLESANHSKRVADFLREEISASGGAISFAEYMHHALYAAGLGYYAAGTRKFGAGGDFVTAPEVSAVFGKVLARQCVDVLGQMESPDLLEIGAGSGRLAVDVLGKLAELRALPKQYLILEVSADLRERQEALLRAEVPELLERVAWVDGWPAQHRGVIVANEVLDALPVERFARRSDQLMQQCVVKDGEGFAIAERPAPEHLAVAVAEIEQNLGQTLPDGYVSEVCIAVPPWIAELAAALQEGMAFLFDYGVSRREYYARERSGGWLRCHFRHHAHNDALVLPGIQDITAWVDFTAVAGAAADHGLDVAGFVTQAQFLINGGLDAELSGLADLPIDAQLRVAGEVKLLTLPGEMGEHFKCMGLSRGSPTRPPALGNAERMAAL